MCAGDVGLNSVNGDMKIQSLAGYTSEPQKQGSGQGVGGGIFSKERKMAPNEKGDKQKQEGKEERLPCVRGLISQLSQVRVPGYKHSAASQGSSWTWLVVPGRHPSRGSDLNWLNCTVALPPWGWGAH